MTQKQPFQEYPRPQLKRDSYFNLNGTWILNGKEIIVPFPPQSKASGYKEKALKKLEYIKEFTLPLDFEKSLNTKQTENRLILHFGAVDQIAYLSVDGNFVGNHIGGYLPFSFDITDYLSNNKIHQIALEVTDDLNHKYPYGKQKKHPGGMWYTPVSGIWQTVWMEIVPEIYVSKVKIFGNTTGIEVFVETTNCQIPEIDDIFDFCVKARIFAKSGKVYEFIADSTYLKIDLPISSSEEEFSLWSPENPNLYEIQLDLFSSKKSLEAGENPIDSVKSYFGLREIAIKNIEGKNRVCLNGKPIFLHSVLDQGYFSEGIFLPESENGFREDIQKMKELGINTLRKHIKIEPEIFYYECDKAGMLVMQDMVNNGSYNFFRDTALPTVLGNFGKKGRKRHLQNKPPKKENEVFFLEHSQETLEHLFNHPSIVYYTIFNEGWGQFNADYLYENLKELDSTRIFDTASGWFKNPKSDVESNHIYFKTPSIKEKTALVEKPVIISECGGYTLKVESHLWNEKKSYGYGSCKSVEELTEKIFQMYEKMIIPAIRHGLFGCVYTQLSDVEEEINGLYTYDRKVCKVEKEIMKKIAALINKEL